MPIKKKLKSKVKKLVVVNRKFLTNLANRIYDPTDRSFLRLCNGTLQNGPDPTDEKRPMHCGLGELYFAMTGKQPEDMGVDEGDVVNLAVELSPLGGLRAKAEAEENAKFEKAAKAIKALGFDNDLTIQLIDTLNEFDRQHGEHIEEEDRDDEEHKLRMMLDAIPDVNDKGCAEGTTATYRQRSRAVAAKLREAAKLLP